MEEDEEKLLKCRDRGGRRAQSALDSKNQDVREGMWKVFYRVGTEGGGG